MIHLRLKNLDVAPGVINLIAGSLNSGQVLVLPTDTVYGLSCLADQIGAIKRIYSLKKRSQQKPLIILVSSLAMLKKYVFVSQKQLLFLKKVWNSTAKPTTIIFRHRGLLPLELSAGSDSLALRLPKSKFLIRILKKVNKPLVSTSLNLSGQEPVYNLQNLIKYFPDRKNYPDLVLDSGQCQKSRPSRVIDLRHPDQPLILRK